MEKIAAHLLNAINRYSRIREFLEGIEDEIGTASDGLLRKMNEDLADLQSQATEYDQMINSTTGNQQVWPSHIQLLFDQRQQLLQDILKINARITTKAKDIQSLIFHDLQRLGKSQAALSGYRQYQDRQGRIVNRTSS